ncbi:hypothetical protein KKC15_06645 [bacterium]|nr:hypothetical protein [bacterium]
MSNFKVEFTLKQHTPIIHFQSGQAGASLRATELKPKLDRFLLANVKNLSSRKNANGDKSLDYKVQVIALSVVRVEIDSRDALFFGNMKPKEMSEDEHERLKKYFIKNETIEIKFLSFIPEVLEAIKKYFEAFIAQTNFGTRQSKGFGSFYLADKETKKSFPFNKDLIPYKVYSFNSNNWKTDIKLLYSFLRQGINYPKGKDITRFYSKPAIFTYAMLNKITWDKKAIKQHFFLNGLKKEQQKYDTISPVNYAGENPYLMRDLFGLSSDQQWGTYYADIKKEDMEKDVKKKMDRFKSPITFKIIGNQVYFWADKSVELMLGKTFKISVKGTPLYLTTPKEFSFDDFFEHVKTIDLSKHIDQKFHKEREFSDLNRILSGIKASK